MASSSRPPGTSSNCAQAVALDADQDDEQVLSRIAEPGPATPDYDFMEQPSQDFFCSVTLELLMEPQLTSCCGHHLSTEASARLQREGKACPMCNEQQWTAMLDKFHRRRTHELRVRCPHKRSGCDWEGEVGDVERHAASCPKRPWECPHCALRYTYGEGEGNHWPACSKFPEPCPNGCEVGSVERCHLEQHHRECPLEPVACEMREFGCSAVVPRRDLATHMRESELQHLTAMAVLNLRLTRQLQQDAAEKDVKIAHLQLEMTKQKEELEREITKEMAEQKKEFKKEMTEQKEDLKKEMTEQKEELKKEMTKQKEKLKEKINAQKGKLKKDLNEMFKKDLSDLKEGVKTLNATTRNIAVHTACHMSKGFTFDKYVERKGKDFELFSSAFYSHEHGYKFKLGINYFASAHNDIGVYLYLEKGEYDDQLPWPVMFKVRLELLNQAGDHHHEERNKSWQWKKESRGSFKEIDQSLMQYAHLEKRGDGVQYMMNDCLQFRLHLTVQAA